MTFYIIKQIFLIAVLVAIAYYCYRVIAEIGEDDKRDLD